MSPGRPLPAGEGKRKLVHASMAGFALLLPWLTWWQAALCAGAAFASNLLVLPRLLGHRLTSERADVSDRGVLLYPVVVLAMILIFWRDLAFAAVGWGFLAFGDAAAGVVGMKWGRRPLRWNRTKTWEGLVGGLAGALFGGTFLLIASLTRGFSRWPWPGLSAADATLRVALVVFFGALVYALVESAPLAVDDNLVAPVLGALTVHAVLVPLAMTGLSRPVWPYWASDGRSWLIAFAINGLCAMVASWKRVLTPVGIGGALVLGLVTWGLGGFRLWLVLLVFLAVGTAVTRVGWKRKAALGIAEGDEGRRGLGNVSSKGAVVFGAAALTPIADPALCAVLATSALAGALADTAGSEVGKAFGRRSYSLPRLRPVPPGTVGAVSVAGTAASVVGAFLIAGLAWQLRMLDLRAAAVCGTVGVVAAFLESGFSRDVDHDAVNLTLTLVAASLAASFVTLLGW